MFSVFNEEEKNTHNNGNEYLNQDIMAHCEYVILNTKGKSVGVEGAQWQTQKKSGGHNKNDHKTLRIFADRGEQGQSEGK